MVKDKGQLYFMRIWGKDKDIAISEIAESLNKLEVGFLIWKTISKRAKSG